MNNFFWIVNIEWGVEQEQTFAPCKSTIDSVYIFDENVIFFWGGGVHAMAKENLLESKLLYAQNAKMAGKGRF